VEAVDDVLEIKVGEQIIFSKKIKLAPTVNFMDSVTYSNPKDLYTVSLGGVKLNYNSDPMANVLSRPLASPASMNWNSAQGLFIQGKEFMDQKLYPQAQEKLAASLLKDSNYIPALVKMSSLLYQQHQFSAALVLAKRALSIDAHDGAANYYYGIIQAQLKNFIDAKDGLDVASLATEYKSAAFTELAKIYIIEKDFSSAFEYCQKAIHYNSFNIAALQYQAIALRYLQQQDTYAKTLDLLTQYDPLNHFAHFEKFYSLKNNEASNKEGSKNEALQAFTHLIQNEQPVETYLQMANDYLQVGLVNEAQSLLAICPAHTLVYYWQAYILQLQGKPFEQALNQANAAAPHFVFPFRNMDVTIFEWAVQQTSHWKPKYYLGLLLKDRNRVVEAKKLFNDLAFIPDYAPFYAARAALYVNENNLPLVYANTIADLQKAISMDASSWRYIKTLTELYNSHYEYAKALALVAPFYKAHSDNYIIGMLYAKTLIHHKDFIAADQLLATLNIIPFEGATIGHELYREAKLMQAIVQIQQKNYTAALHFIDQAKLWPENLGAGKPYDEDIDIRLENWLSYVCFQQLKQSDSAQSKLNAIVQFMPSINNTISNFYAANHLVSIWAYRALGQSAKGANWLQQQMSKYPDNPILKWVQKAGMSTTLHELPSISIQLEDATMRLLRKL
jgi:tetratricopeptide (TPR) repeat protein